MSTLSPSDGSSLQDTIGLVTQFDATPTPEPASLVLLGSGVLWLRGLCQRRN
jgi:hypothetical protein